MDCVKRSKVVKTKILNPPRQDWINKEIIKEINDRNILWKEHKTQPDDENTEKLFKKKRNEVSFKIQEAKSTYYIKAFDETKSKPAKMWKLINTLSNNKVMQTPAPSKLQSEQGYLTELKEICEHFNNYFSSIGSILADQIPSNILNNLADSAKLCETSKTCKILNQLPPTNVNEIDAIINNLNSNTSAGIDGINAKSIKSLKHIITIELTNCINRCLEQGIFPTSLKIARVTPVFKAGNKSDPGNYRPISVLPIISKIFERVLYKRLDSFLCSINFLFSKQYGFRPKSNALSASMDIVTKLKISIDRKKLAIGIFIDLKKAFDTISHDRLIEKLYELGITSLALEIFKSYLKDRQQIVKIGDTQSSAKAIEYGVPQGSILGPLLFI